MFRYLFKATRIAAVALYMAAAAILVSCEGLEITVPGTQEETIARLSVPQNELGCMGGSIMITVSASGPWTMELMFDNLSDPWAELKKDSGEGDGFNTLYWSDNDSGADRALSVVLKTGGKTLSSRITQKSSNPPAPTELEPDPVPQWMELPATNDPDRYFFTHDMTLGRTTVRNYSFYLDPKALVSVWVAYPLNKDLISSGSRTNAWGDDPKVPLKYQASVTSAFKGGYQRGHQIPSADRYEINANKATFYGTNMTPQKAELNEEAWAKLEGKVRNWSYQFDTLYVVTGADIVGSNQVAYDNMGKAITVPVGYFKALLGYKKGASSTQFPSQKSGFLGIGFYFEHRGYATDNAAIMAQSMTIDELEAKTGFDFFVNLPDEDETVIESTLSTWWN